MLVGGLTAVVREGRRWSYSCSERGKKVGLQL